MKEGITVTGIVLSVMPMGEYDRRIVLLTKELGKISVFAQGARRPNSAFVACTQTFTFGSFRLYPGKSAYKLTGAEVKNYFSELRDNYEWVYRGMYFCEFAEYYAQEGVDETDILKLLYVSLRALSNPNLDARLIKAIYDLRLITIEGEGPQVTECVRCKSSYKETDAIPESLLFSIRKGGLLCEKCEAQDPDAMRVHRGTIYALQFICTAPIEKLYTFTLAEENLKELASIVTHYKKLYVNKTMKSEELY